MFLRLLSLTLASLGDAAGTWIMAELLFSQKSSRFTDRRIRFSVIWFIQAAVLSGCLLISDSVSAGIFLLADFLAGTAAVLFLWKLSFYKAVLTGGAVSVLMGTSWVLSCILNPRLRLIFDISDFDVLALIIQVSAVSCVVKAIPGFLFSERRKMIFEKMNSRVLLLVLYVGSLLILLPIMMGANPENTGRIIFYLVPACMIVTFIIVSLIFRDRQKAMRELESSQEFSNLQKNYIDSITRSNSEALQFQTDLQDVIVRTSQLIEQNRMEEARALLKSISGRIGKEEKTSWTLNPVVNAVLSEKNKTCREKGIELVCDLILQEKLNVDSLDLCRALGNILDNAIRSADRCEGEAKEIILKGREISGYLVFQCSNPYLLSDRGKILGTGYGQQILKDLAARYQGRFRTESGDNGIYTVHLSLKTSIE